MSDWKAQATALREQGFSVREIAEKVGKGRSTVGEYLTPHRCDCGKRRNHNSEKCVDCSRAERHWHSERVLELVAGMYDDGWLLRDIALVLGRTVLNARQAGRAVGPELDAARKRGLLTTTRVRTGYGTWGQA